MAYIPTPGPLPGVQWIPSNGTVGMAFVGDWCTHCARDKAMREGAPLEECDDNQLCEILAAPIWVKPVAVALSVAGRIDA